MTIKETKQRAKLMIEQDADLINAYLKGEDMVHGRWSLPAGLSEADGIHKVVISDPYDAMNALRRILSKHQPNIKIHPLAPNLATREKTDMMERGMKWMYKQASNRRMNDDLTADLAWSAGLYGQCIGQVLYIPHEIDAAKGRGVSTEYLEEALVDGPFVVELHNAREVRVQRSSYGVEGILSTKMMRVDEAMAFWGDLAKPLLSKASGRSKVEKQMSFVTVYDYWNKKKRDVWMILQEFDNGLADPEDKEALTIFENEEHGIPFLPWFARMTGTGLEHSTRNQVNTMLKPLIDTGLYDTQNSLETMIMSKSIKLFGRPGAKEEGPNPAKTEIDYDIDGLGEIAKVPPGNTLAEMRQEVLDQALLTMADKGYARIDKSTVSRLLQTGEFPSGTAASAINIITQSAVESIGPFKRLAERVIEDIVRLELRWIHFKDEPLVIDGAADVGQEQVVINPEDINPAYLYVDVELTAVAPTDMVARANAGMSMQQMGYPMQRVFEQLGEQDPIQAMKETRREQMVQALHAAKLAEIEIGVETMRAEAQLGVQMKAQELQMQAQAQAQAQQAPQTPSTGMEGQGFNTGAGGQSSVPPSGATYEQQTGQTRDGTPL